MFACENAVCETITKTLAAAMVACFLTAAAPGFAADAREPGADRVQLTLDLQGFDGEVNDLAFSHDGSMLAAAGGKVVRLYEVRTGRLVRTLRGQIDDGAYGDCLSVAFSPDNCELVVGIRSNTKHGSLRVYDTQDFTHIKALVPGHQLPVAELAFSRDGRYLATADAAGNVQLFDWPMRRLLVQVEKAYDATQNFGTFCFPTDELFLLSSAADGPALIAVPSGRRIEIERGPHGIAAWLAARDRYQLPFESVPHDCHLALDRQSWIAFGSGKADGATKNWVGIWRTSRAEPVCTFQGHVDAVTACTFDTTCRLAASADRRGEIHIWNAATGQDLVELNSVGRPKYRAALDQNTQRIGFTERPTTGKAWTYNSFGRIDRTFDVPSRNCLAAADGNFPDEIVQRDGARLAVTYENERFGLKLTGNQRQQQITLDAGSTLSCFSLLDGRNFGIENAIVAGDYRGDLRCFNPATGAVLRNFAGHAGQITSLSQSADGRFLVSSSTDRTIRIWSLENYHQSAGVGFSHDGSLVTEVPRGSAAERAGIRVGDAFLAIEGHTLIELATLQAAGRSPLRIGQRALVSMRRSGVGYQTQLTLVAGPDQVEPLLTLLIADDNQWIMWTPQGYYDASPGAGRLLGFHVNRGVDRAASFISVHQFRDQLYRPDVIQEIFAAGNISQAITQANQRWADAPDPLDLRDNQTITRHSPPEVRILAPTEGTTTREGQIHVLAEIVSPEGTIVKDVRVLVNGRPGMEKGASIIAEDEDASQRVSFSRAVSLLPGENTISVVASHDDAVSEPVTVTVQYDAPDEEKNLKPNLHLLAIGVSEYANAQLNLRYAHFDAEKFSQAWEGQKGPVYNALIKNVLVNEQASAQGVVDSLRTLLNNAQRHDVAVIFISAHGLRDDNFEYYLGTHDVDPRKLSDTGVHFSQITRYLDQLPCKVMVFVDTCHAAGITGAKAVFKDPLYELTSDEHGVIVFSSSLSREISFENEAWGHGAFTKAILDTLGDRQSDINRDGYLSLTELEQRVYDQVQQMTGGRQHPVMNRPATVPNIRFYYLGDS